MTPSASIVAKIKVWQWLVVSFLIAIGVALVLFFRGHGIAIDPLPADEEIIANFQEHRADIEALVKSYREFRPTPQKKIWDEMPEIRALKQRADVRSLSEVGPTWFPDPYSVESAKQFRANLKSKYVTAWDLMPFRSIEVTGTKEFLPKMVLVPYGSRLVFKELVYMPEVPRIENGKLWWPVNVDGSMKWGDRVFPSLDDFPPDWKRGECVYRQLESQWFICMCAAR